MNRNNINGFTLRGFGYSLEFVTINHLLRVIALYDWKQNITRRIEI